MFKRGLFLNRLNLICILFFFFGFLNIALGEPLPKNRSVLLMNLVQLDKSPVPGSAGRLSQSEWGVAEGMGVAIGQCLLTAGHIFTRKNEFGARAFDKYLVISPFGQITEINPQFIYSPWTSDSGTAHKFDFAIARMKEYFLDYLEFEDLYLNGDINTLEEGSYFFNPTRNSTGEAPLENLRIRQTNIRNSYWLPLSYSGSEDPAYKHYENIARYSHSLKLSLENSSLHFKGHSGGALWTEDSSGNYKLAGIYSANAALLVSNSASPSLSREIFAPIGENSDWLLDYLKEFDCFNFSQEALKLDDYYHSRYLPWINGEPLEEETPFKTPRTSRTHIKNTGPTDIEPEDTTPTEPRPVFNRRRRMGGGKDSTPSLSAKKDLD